MQHFEGFSTIPRLAEVAAHLVHKCLKVEAGELVHVVGGIHQYWLLSQITVEISKAGGDFVLDIRDDTSTLQKINDVPDDHVGKIHPAVEELHDKVDAKLIIYPVFDPETEKHRNSHKLALINERNPFRKKPRTARYLGMEWPTSAKAKLYGYSIEEFEELYWNAFWIDLDELTKNAQILKGKIENTKDVVITSEDGSVLHLSIQNRPVWMDTGCFTEELMKTGDLTKNLPCGEVYCSPIEESTHGTVFFQQVFTQGTWIRNLKLTFDQGYITQISAEQGQDVFENILAQHTGDKSRIAELGIGLNPKVPKVMGNTLLDEKVVGSIHIALGHNTMYGGVNVSSLHWDLISMNPSIVADGKSIMENGKLHLD